MANPSAAEAKLVDKSNNPQIADQQTNVVKITNNTGQSADQWQVDFSTTTTVAQDIATLAAKINEIIDVLEAHGLSSDT
jgi:hypothetical protein